MNLGRTPTNEPKDKEIDDNALYLRDDIDSMNQEKETEENFQGFYKKEQIIEWSQ